MSTPKTRPPPAHVFSNDSFQSFMADSSLIRINSSVNTPSHVRAIHPMNLHNERGRSANPPKTPQHFTFNDSQKIKNGRRTTANSPIPSPVAKHAKNPLVWDLNSSYSQLNDLVKIVETKNDDLYKITNEKVELETHVSRLSSEVRNMQQMLSIAEERKLQIQKLQISLQMATEEADELRKEVDSYYEDETQVGGIDYDIQEKMDLFRNQLMIALDN